MIVDREEFRQAAGALLVSAIIGACFGSFFHHWEVGVVAGIIWLKMVEG